MNPKPPKKAVFLHTGYRTAGTWVWSCFRTLDDVVAYYEPLHEMLAKLDAVSLAKSTSDSWDSGHPKLAQPYFAEFASLLQAGAPGVRGYQEAFAVDRFHDLPPPHAAELEAYLRGLMEVARERGGVPVFKFCRSLGRLPWLRRTFRDSVHVVVEKNPVSQWQSCWQRFATRDNAHFVAAPFAVLSSNRDVPLVERVIDGLRVPLPPVPDEAGMSVVARLDFFMQYVRQIPPTAAYRAFLAHWLLSLRHAHTDAHAIFDCDLAVHSAAYAEAAERWISDLTGLAPTFQSAHRRSAEPTGCGFSAHEGLDIHLEAMQLAEALASDGLAQADTLALWRNKLAQATQVLAFGAHANWPRDNVSPHLATNIVDVPLTDGADLERALLGELRATRLALTQAQQRITDLQKPTIVRLARKIWPAPRRVRAAS